MSRLIIAGMNTKNSSSTVAPASIHRHAAIIIRIHETFSDGASIRVSMRKATSVPENRKMLSINKTKIAIGEACLAVKRKVGRMA